MDKHMHAYKIIQTTNRPSQIVVYVVYVANVFKSLFGIIRLLQNP